MPWLPFNFLSLPEEQSRLERARVVVLSVPYDSTTSFRGGARNGPRAIVEASYNLEDYDAELMADVSQVGVHTASAIEPHMAGPEPMVERVRQGVDTFLQQDRLVALLGGEHSISVGSVAAHRDRYPDLSVLFLDAHADFREEYMDTRWGHASVARRIHELCPVVLVGTRSLSGEEQQSLTEQGIQPFFWPPEEDVASTAKEATARLSPHVYVSVDLDVLDPAIMAAVGTPEPGGMDWLQITRLLRQVAEARQIVGFDVTELSPAEGPTACAYTAAKLVYKLIGYSMVLPQAGQGQ